MPCDNCGSKKLIGVYAKCSDRCCIDVYTGVDHDGYVPTNIGLGKDSDAVTIDYCIDCGKIQGKFPIQLPERFEKVEQED